jgi:hypothetical protein
MAGDSVGRIRGMLITGHACLHGNRTAALAWGVIRPARKHAHSARFSLLPPPQGLGRAPPPPLRARAGTAPAARARAGTAPAARARAGTAPAARARTGTAPAARARAGTAPAARARTGTAPAAGARTGTAPAAGARTGSRLGYITSIHAIGGTKAGGGRLATLHRTAHKGTGG